MKKSYWIRTWWVHGEKKQSEKYQMRKNGEEFNYFWDTKKAAISFLKREGYKKHGKLFRIAVKSKVDKQNTWYEYARIDDAY